jgi:flagellar motor component MotA
VENQDSEADNEATNAVLREVVNLTSKNRKSVLKAKELLDETQEERPFLEENLGRVVEQNRQMKIEEQGLRENFRNTDRRLEELRISYEQSVGRFT